MKQTIRIKSALLLAAGCSLLTSACWAAKLGAGTHRGIRCPANGAPPRPPGAGPRGCTRAAGRRRLRISPDHGRGPDGARRSVLSSGDSRKRIGSVPGLRCIRLRRDRSSPIVPCGTPAGQAPVVHGRESRSQPPLPANPTSTEPEFPLILSPSRRPLPPDP